MGTPTASTAMPTTTPNSGTCAEAWQQCGGPGWTGSTCCASGFTCVQLSWSYSMCERSSVVGTPTATVSTSTTEAATTAPAGDSCAGPWQKCGGNGWTGTTCCVSGYFCRELSEWHSQCDPVGSFLLLH